MSSNQPTRLESLSIPSWNGARVRDAVLSPVPDFMGVILEGQPAQVFDLRRGAQTGFPVSRPVTGMAFRARSQHMPTSEVAVATGGHGSAVLRYDLDLGIGLIHVFHPRAHSVAYCHEGRYLAAGSTDGLVRVWDITGDVPPRPVSRWVKDDRGGSRQVWSQEPTFLDRPPQEICYERISNDCITGLAFNATGDILFVTTSSGKLLRKYVRRKDVAAEPYLRHDGKPFDWDCYCVATHPHTQLAAFGGYGNRVYLARVDDGKIVALDTAVGRFVRKLEFLEKDARLVVIGEKGVQIWNLSPLGPAALANPGPFPGTALAARQYGGKVFVARA